MAVVALGGFGAYALLSGGGSQPAEAMPADTIGYLSVDLDPSADQKIEAVRILRKFPGIEQELDISDREDLRRYVFEKIQEEGGCPDLDYDADIEPWIGDRIAVAGVPTRADGVAPVMALQVKDRDAAAKGIDTLAACGEAGGESQGGYAFSGDYVLLAKTEEQARSFADQAASASLADDETFQQRMDEAGGSGLVTMYVSAQAPSRMADLMSELDPSMSSPDLVADPTGFEADAVGASAQGSDMDRMSEEMQKLYEDFDGGAGVVRFEDGAVELEFAVAGMPTGLPGTAATGTQITELPASTGAAFAVALPDNWLQEYLDQMSAALGGEADFEQVLAQVEAETGLELPEDIETLLGDGVAVAFDAENDFEALERSEDGKELLAGIRVQGDAEEIMQVVDKLRARLGPGADPVLVEESGDVVAFGLNQGYVDGLVGDGGLGSVASFQDVVPNADEASSVFYLDFDAGSGWAVEVADLASGGSPQVRENVEPLDAVGLSTWVDGEVQHSLFRMTTD